MSGVLDLNEFKDDGQWKRWVVMGLGALLLVAAGGYLVHSLMGGKGGAKPKPPKITLMLDKPPPPPPPEVKKPEPPKPDQKDIKAEPPKEPQPAQNEPMKMEGAAGDGPSPFAAGSVSKDYIGGAVGLGGGMQYAFYTNLLQRHLQEELNRIRKLRDSDYRVTVRLWLNKDGGVRRAELAQSTGNEAIDDLLRHALTQVAAMRDAPPENMPQPVRIRVTARGAG